MNTSGSERLRVCTPYMQLDELGEAEDALAEANVLNNENALTWAYLSLVCLRTGRPLEAEQTFKYAIRVS